jgi:hypothetical protein
MLFPTVVVALGFVVERAAFIFLLSLCRSPVRPQYLFDFVLFVLGQIALFVLRKHPQLEIDWLCLNCSVMFNELT